MTNVERLISTCVELGATQAMVNLGVTSGEISLRKARNIYGKWFMDAYHNNRIFPVRVEDGRAGTKVFSVTDILKLKAQDSLKAEIIFK